MTADSRVARLRALVAQLERLPSTDRRERTLMDVRVRIADLQTGEDTQAMRPGEPSPLAGSRARALRSNARAVRRPRPTPAAKPKPPEPPPRRGSDERTARDAVPSSPAPGGDDVLSLEDRAEWSPDPGDGAEGTDRWRRGLRG